MSITTMNWALRLTLPPRTSTAKALLMVLSYRARLTAAEKFECYPSISYLAGVTGQNRKTIQSNLVKLQRWGLLSDTGRRMGKTRQVIVYRLHLRETISTGHPQKSEKNAERGPKTNVKKPKKDGEHGQTRDTNSSISIDGDRCFYAHAREKIDTRPATEAPNDLAPGDARAQVMAQIQELVRTLQPHKAKRPPRPIDSVEADPREGGAA